MDDFAESIASLEQLAKSEATPSMLRRETRFVTESIVNVISDEVDLDQLNDKLKRRHEVDLSDLRELLRRAREWAGQGVRNRSGQESVPYQEIITAFANLLERVERDQPTMSRIERVLRLEYGFSSLISRLLRAYGDSNPEFTAWLELGIIMRVERLTLSEKRRLFASLSALFDPPPDGFPAAKLSYVDTIISPEFFGSTVDADLPARIAEFYVRRHPALEAALYRGGQDRFPVLPTGIATILTVADAGISLTRDEESTARYLAELRAIWKERAPGEWDADWLDEALQIERRPYLQRTVAADEIRIDHPQGYAPSRVVDVKKFVAEVSYVLRALIRVVRAPRIDVGSVEDYLHRFKLATEVLLPNIRAELLPLNEIELQKRLVSYLVQHGFLAVGIGFGQSELDVYAQRREPGWNALGIEAKKYKRPPSDARIREASAQLLSYLDQAPRKLRGALFLFNFSDIPILGPREWIADRIMIIAVNLGTLSPSRREGTIIVEQGIGDQVISVSRNYRPGSPPEPRGATPSPA